MTDFLPDDYETPIGESNYMKFDQGENKFRILSRPVIGWEDWKDKQPHRFPMDQKPDRAMEPNGRIKHFWAMTVWNYKNEAVQLLQITQASIQKAIKGLAEDSDWGNPSEYDIKVKREGEGLDTVYAINPSPKSILEDHIRVAYEEKPINLTALFAGDDPFEVVELEAVDDDLPF